MYQAFVGVKGVVQALDSHLLLSSKLMMFWISNSFALQAHENQPNRDCIFATLVTVRAGFVPRLEKFY